MVLVWFKTNSFGLDTFVQIDQFNHDISEAEHCFFFFFYFLESVLCMIVITVQILFKMYSPIDHNDIMMIHLDFSYLLILYIYLSLY